MKKVYYSWLYRPGTLPTGSLFKFSASEQIYRVGEAGNLIRL